MDFVSSFFMDRRQPWHSSSSAGYSILPVSSTNSSPTRDHHYHHHHHSTTEKLSRRGFANRRYLRALFSIALASGFVFIWYRSQYHERGPSEYEILQQWHEDYPELPPLYEAYHELERNLTQNQADYEPPDGKPVKYFFPANHVHGSGWGNALQELFMNAHLAHSAGRSFVWDNYTWDRDGPDYSDFNGKLIPSRIPLSAMISSPINGGPLPPNDPGPLSISRERFLEVCPRSKRVVLDSQEVISELKASNWDTTAGQVFDVWVRRLTTMDEPCVEVDVNTNQIFDIWHFGSDRILDIWPTFQHSPMLTKFAWSPLIHKAFTRNQALFAPSPESTGLLSFLPSLSSSSSQKNEDPYAPIEGLLALHIRRGDFEGHCHHFAQYSSSWNGFCLYPGLPDRFDAPTHPPSGEVTAEKTAAYLQRCYPSVAQIVDKVRAIREANAGLKRVFIMTNGALEWVEELKDALRKDAGAREDGQGGAWEAVFSSRDMKLAWEEKYVAQAVDMLIGQRAEVFVGNGFSSLTSNIAMLRISKGFPLSSIRFW